MSVHRQRWSALPVLAVLALVGLACTPAAGQPADLADHGTDEPPYNPPTTNNTIIDVYNRTATTTVFIQWKDGRPSNYKMYFRRANVPLSFGDNYFEIWTSYRAPNVARANTILQQIKAAIECPTPSDCPSGFPSRSVNEWVKQYIANVRGEGLSTIFSRPTECNGALPNSCPATDGRYGPNLINVPAVWERLPGVDSANPTVGVLVIDTGLLITHEEFRDNENLVPGVSIDLSTNTPAPITEAQNNGHGTHVAGTVFARWNNGGVPGMVGRARGAVCRSFVPTPDGPRAPDEAVVRCINHAIANNLDIINLSLGGAQGRPLPAGDITRLAYENFCRQGGIFAIAAGNDNVNIGAPNFVYPAFFANDLAATFPNCILTVAAVDANGVLSDFGPRPGGRAGTNFGTGVGVAAPGSNILSAGIQSNTALVQLSGTSMASPHVAGVMTLLWNAFPRLTGAQVVNCIRTTATRPATNSPNVPGQGRIDGGIVNANAAFDCLQALAGPNPGRFNCIPGGNKRPQVCLTAAQIGTVIPLGPGARLTACAVTRVPGRGRHLLQDDAVATASATEPDTFKNSPPVCGAFGDQVCISWRHSISSPFLSIRVTATDAGGASRSADIDITLLRQRTWRGNTRPGCVPA